MAAEGSWIFTGVVLGIIPLMFVLAWYFDKRNDKKHPPRPALREPDNFEEFASLCSLRTEDSPDLKWVLARDGKSESYQLVEGSRLFATYSEGVGYARSHDGALYIHGSVFNSRATIESFQTGRVVSSVIAKFEPTLLIRLGLGLSNHKPGILEFKTGLRVKWEDDGWLVEGIHPAVSNSKEFLVWFESHAKSIHHKDNLSWSVNIGAQGFSLTELPVLVIFGFYLELMSFIDRASGMPAAG